MMNKCKCWIAMTFKLKGAVPIWVTVMCFHDSVCVGSGKLVLPSQLAVNYGNVTHAGQVADIADILQNVQELDLSKNKIAQWHEVQTWSFCPTVIVFFT